MLNKDNNPWLGLASYEYEDAYRFFGRENELVRLKDCVCNNLITTIYGISGAGKTSLINAGMCPLLEKEDYLPVRIRLTHESKDSYSDQIIKTVQAAVIKVNGDVEVTTSLKTNTISSEGNIIDSIPEEEKLWWFFHTNQFWSQTNHRLCPAVFIDQFEEIFTKNEDPNVIQEFFNSIDSLQYDIPPATSSKLLDTQEEHTDLNDLKNFRFVFVMREDFLARLEDYSFDIPALRKNRNGIKRMNGIQALEVIMRPQPDIVNRDVALSIIGKVTGQPIKDNTAYLESLSIDTSLLSLFCSEVFNKAAEKQLDTITKTLIDQFGENILSSFYASTMKMVSANTVSYLENHLLTRSGFRNSVALEDILADGIKQEELEKLSKKRLIRIETSNGTDRVEFTHDVLCSIAKESRDKELEKVHKKSATRTIIGFIIDLAIPTVLFIYFAISTYIHTEYNSISEFVTDRVFLFYCLIFISVSIIGVNAFIISPYRFTKERNSKTILFASFIGNLLPIAFITLLFVEFSESYFDETFGDEETAIGILWSIVPVYQLILFFHSLKFKKKNHNAKQTLKYILHLEIYKDYPVFKSILKIWGIIVIMMVSVLTGFTLRTEIALISILIGCITSLYIVFDLTGSPIHLTWKSLLINGCQVLLLVGLVFAQYSRHHLILMLLCWIALFASVAYLMYVNKTDETSPKSKLVAVSLIWGFVFLLMPSVNLGYNVFNNASYARTTHGVISANRTMRFLIIKDKDNNKGVRDRWHMVIPVEYDSIIRKTIFDRQDDYISEITFWTIKDGRSNKWLCSEHLGTRNICSDKIAEYLWKTFSFKRDNSLLRYMDANRGKYKESEIDDVINRRFIYEIENGIWRYLNQQAKQLHADKTRIFISFNSEIGPSWQEYQLKLDSINHCLDSINKLIEFERTRYYPSDFLDDLVKSIDTNNYYILDHRFLDGVINSNLELLARNRDQKICRLILDSIYSKCTNVEDSSSYFVSLSYYKLFARDFEGSEKASRNAIKQDSSAVIAYTNLFDALYLREKYDSAFVILEKYKDVDCLSDTILIKHFGDGIWGDFCDLIGWDIYKPKESKEYQRLQDILKDYIEKPRYTAGYNWFGIENRYKTDNDGNFEYWYFCKNNKILTPPVSSYHWHTDETDSIVWFKSNENEKCGYYIYNGCNDQLITPQYDHSWIFSEGLAAVIIEDTIGFINKNGEYVIPKLFPYSYEKALETRADIVDFVFHDGFCPIVASPGKHGLINKEGQWVVQPEFSYINNPINGYRIVRKQDKYGLMNSRLQIVLPVEYNWINQNQDDNTITINDSKYSYSELEKMVKL